MDRDLSSSSKSGIYLLCVAQIKRRLRRDASASSAYHFSVEFKCLETVIPSEVEESSFGQHAVVPHHLFRLKVCVT